MIIPNAEHAFVDLEKLRGYALNPSHRIGGHKAHLFASLLGISMTDAEEFRNILLEVVSTYDADIGEYDKHGQRYRIGFVMSWRGQQATVRCAWNVRPNQDFPRLVTCYPL